MNINDIHVAEYSVSQDAYHVETLPEMIKTNWMIIEMGRSVDYIPIGFFNSYLAASEFIEKYKHERQKRTIQTSQLHTKGH